MRISSVTMFEKSTASMNRQQSDFLRVSQQIASGRRVVNPSDDPQAAARAVGVDQSMAINEQYTNSRVSARNSLAQTESVLNSVSDAVTRAKTLLIQASSDTLSDADRQSISSELKGVYETLIGQANATDGNGRYLFGGYKDDAPPFFKNDSGKVEYRGDASAREQQVDASRRMPVAENGRSIFQSVASNASYIAKANPDNTGNVTFAGLSVKDSSDANFGASFTVRFEENTAGEGFVYRVEGPEGELTNGAYTGDGQQIAFGGVSLTLTGTPEVGDEISVARAGSAEQPADLFKTLEAVIGVLENPAETDAEKAALRNTLNTSMRELDNALDNVLTVRASAGARLNELDVIDAVGSNRMMNYAQTLSDLVDLDYAEAISEYSLRQVGLQASQRTFVEMKSMSLFNYM
ncbi:MULTISPECIES: flagellar hook-associated protein FlgL [unclassified Halomonas]|uniref:flagellar hook-associated protein FlgL n=1 Tax=unclassified Halomonas TaxID=2609666 RepID=UPI00209FFD91|nr:MULTISPECIES: flagellar hook-associated protein FlgL [unclassified Halomonas]MCP1315120.1 flagellar hook-associated protein FlgL [Halomonas sp. 707D7]MCP1325768.1 flagellar hook-associated protein FlgL [Halomonas sp. 707D4]